MYTYGQRNESGSGNEYRDHGERETENENCNESKTKHNVRKSCQMVKEERVKVNECKW